MRGISLAAFLVVVAGCQSVRITSEPAGAMVYVNGESRGQTPISVLLPRSSEHEVALKLDGYADWHVKVERVKREPLVGSEVTGAASTFSLVRSIVTKNPVAYLLGCCGRTLFGSVTGKYNWNLEPAEIEAVLEPL